jgi:hypothetical protein
MPNTKQTPKRKYKPRLTMLECRLVEALPESKTYKEAGLKAGLSKKNISHNVHCALQRIRRKMPEIFEEMGLTPEFVVNRHLVPLMDAQDIRFLDGDRWVRVPDNPSRLRALHIYCLLAGIYAPKDQLQQQGEFRGLVLDIPRPRLPETNGDTENGPASER